MAKPKLVVLVGFPASTKSTWAAEYKDNHLDAEVVSRDVQGGKTSDALPFVRSLLSQGTTVVVDNTNITREIRDPFIAIGKELGLAVECVYFKTTIEDCQIRMLHRTWEKYGKLYMKGKAEKGEPAAKDPGVLPPATFFSARKRMQEPHLDEGFDVITVVEPKLVWPKKYKNKALFLDIDGTVRVTSDLPKKYPTDPSQVRLLHDAARMKDVLRKYIDKGYMIVGVSNQSGISKGTVTESVVDACMNKTRALLDMDADAFPIVYCPHNPAPISCFCRKPQLGMPMAFIEKYKLNPGKCVMVGDQKTDETMATRLGMTFKHTSKFW